MRAVLPLLLLAACAVQPPAKIDPGLLAAKAAADPAHALDLMRREGERLARRPFLPGNDVALLLNGPASFRALSDAIRSGRTRIDMESYEFDDQAGGRFAQLLVDAAARGVSVHLIYDAWGTLHTPEVLFTQIKAGGVKILEYNPLVPNARVPLNINDRDHRKLLCVDGAVAITGGVNISRVYENDVALPKLDPNDEAWRDTDVRIKGPVVAQFEHYFSETWHRQHGIPIGEPPPAPAAMPGGLEVQAIDGAPDNGRPLIYRTLLAAMALAQRSIHLTTGFFVPTPDLRRGLEAAARRGVDVELIVPDRSTSTLAIVAGRSDYGELLQAGVRISEYQGRILHAKTAVIDGQWSAVGSSNLDWRSTVWNNEIDAIILGATFGSQMEAVFRHDEATSKPVTLQAWRSRGIGERLSEIEAELVEDLL